MVYYIYFPGLGGEKTVERQYRAIKSWNSHKRHAILIDPLWHDLTETFVDKLQRIVREVQQYMKGKAGRFCVVGSSAGASMAVILYEELSLDGAVLIAGKLVNPHSIGKSYNAVAPQLRASVVKSQNVINNLKVDRKKSVLTISPLIDEVVTKKDMMIKGVKNTQSNVPGHVFAIGYMLVFGKKNIFKWFESL